MFPKMGKTFPNGSAAPVDRLEFAMAVAAALNRELGNSHRAIKTVMKWTGVSDRTAKNWLAGTHAPTGEHTANLMRHSDEVLMTVLQVSGRDACGVAIQLAELRSALVHMATVADEILNSQASLPQES